MLVGGVVQFYAGGPPARAGETPQTSTLLVEHPIRSTRLTEKGLEAQVASTSGRATGTPKWFQARAPGGTVLLDGEVGRDAGQWRIDPPTIVEGGRVDAVAFVMGWGN